MYKSFLYSNVFICYKCYLMSGEKWRLFEHFKPLNNSFSVVNLYIFEETYILLELPFHMELNGLCPNSVY